MRSESRSLGVSCFSCVAARFLSAPADGAAAGLPRTAMVRCHGMTAARPAAGSAATSLPAIASKGVSVVVAAFREEQTIAETVRSLRRLGLDVIVVDDGSEDETGRIARQEGATVLTHIVNRGQGAALQTGVRFALARGAAYIVTFDADGQHQSEDVAGILAPLLRGESDVTLGSRFLRPNEVPWFRRVVLKTGIVFTRLASGIRVTDTHNGLRGFTRRAAATIDIRLDRMAHASEILDQIARSGLRWVEVPVEISYTDYSRSKGQSSLGGLRVVWDFLMGRWLR